MSSPSNIVFIATPAEAAAAGAFGAILLSWFYKTLKWQNFKESVFLTAKTTAMIMFALWTACSLASLALPGMSGFVSELMVFTGFVTDEVYTLPFRIVMASLAAIGVILTPIYLLSMLREIFFGKENPKLTEERKLVDAEPREIYIIACLLLPIIGIGLYPRLVTESYLASINNLVDRDLNAVKSAVKTNIFSGNKKNEIFKAPPI